MSRVVELLRRVFPAVMIVICSTIYFVVFDGRGPTELPEKREAIPQAANRGEWVVELGKPTPLDNEVVSRINPYLEQSATIEMVGMVAEEALPDVSNLTPIERLELPLQSIASSDIPEPQQTATDPPGRPEVEDGVDKGRYARTPVQDYWVGLERARTHSMDKAKTAGQQSRIDAGLIHNPYFERDTRSEHQPQPLPTPSESIQRSTTPDLEQVSTQTTIPTGRVEQVREAENEFVRALQFQWEESIESEQRVEPATASERTSDWEHTNFTHSARQASGRHIEPVRTPYPITEHVRQRVLEHWEYGSSLARRHAIQLAQREFFSGLSLLADHFDQIENSTQYLTALREGFAALQEAADFESSSSLRPADVAVIASGHTTPLIRDHHFETTSHSQARSAYYLYAKERLKFVFYNQVAADELLYALGKLHLANFEQSRKTDNVEFQRAATLFECALLANPRHAKSNNELAVILAKNGHWSAAKQLLQQTVGQNSEFIEAWENLVKVHRQLGEVEMARLAMAQVERLRTQVTETPSVRMVSKMEFAQVAAAMDENDHVANQPADVGQRRSVLDGDANLSPPPAGNPAIFGQGRQLR